MQAITDGYQIDLFGSPVVVPLSEIMYSRWLPPQSGNSGIYISFLYPTAINYLVVDPVNPDWLLAELGYGGFLFCWWYCVPEFTPLEGIGNFLLFRCYADGRICGIHSIQNGGSLNG